MYKPNSISPIINLSGVILLDQSIPIYLHTMNDFGEMSAFHSQNHHLPSSCLNNISCNRHVYMCDTVTWHSHTKTLE